MKRTPDKKKSRSEANNSVNLTDNQSVNQRSVDAENTMNPFVGLRAFNHSESHLFFGREEHIADVRTKLESNHFVAVVGTSGTGKSSLIRAGVLPSIQAENQNPETSSWNIVSMKPGNDPLGNLSRAVSDEFEPMEFQKTLDLVKRSSLGLVQAMRGIMQEGERLLILVDQFEEVFRFTNDASEDAMAVYNHFVQALVDTMRQRDIPIYIILTLRSDFLGDCVRFQGLPEAINDGHYLVPRMREDQVKRVITDPIALAEARISPRVVQKVIHEMGHDSDRLPILQHALMRTFDVWKEGGISGEPIDVKHLDKTGGLNRALSVHADEAFHELSANQHELAARIFKALTVKAEGSRGVRRPMSLSQLEEVIQSSQEDILKVLRPFRKEGRSFILPGLDTQTNDSTIFDISHESLMRGWDRLKIWTEEEMDSAALYIRICEAAVLHKEGSAALWRDPELQLAEDWKSRQNPNAAWAKLYHPAFNEAIKFLQKSHDKQEAELSARKRRAVLIRSAAIVFIVVVSVLSVWALYQSNIATEKSLEAQAKSEEALSEKEKALAASQEAEKARLTAEEEAERAERQAQLAAEQERIASIERNKAQSAAARALTEQQKALNQKELADIKTIEALTQKQKADSARDAAYQLRMIALSENLAYQSAQITSNPELAALLAIESFKVAKKNGGNINSPSLYAAARKAIEDLDNSYSPIKATTATRADALGVFGNGVSLICKDGTYVEFNAANGYEMIKSESKLPGEEELSASFLLGESGNYLLGLKSQEILSGDQVKLAGHSALLRGASTSMDGKLIITGDRAGLIKVWENESEVHSANLNSRIRNISRIGASDEFLVALENGKVKKFSLTDYSVSDYAQKDGVRAEVVSSSLNGENIAIGYSDGLVEVYSKKGNRLAELPHVGSIRFIRLVAEDDLLLVSTSTKSVFLYELENLTALPTEISDNRSIDGLDYLPESKALVYITSDREIKEFPVRNSTWIDQLEQLVSRELTAEERRTLIGEN